MKTLSTNELIGIQGGEKEGWDFLCGVAGAATVLQALSGNVVGAVLTYAFVSGPICAYAIAT